MAAEPEACPKLTKGQFMYDYGDEAGYTPLLPMYSLGHTFTPAGIHAGGLRYHGAGTIASCLLGEGRIEAVDIGQKESFRAGVLFARTEGIVPAPESAHAIAATVREAIRAGRHSQDNPVLPLRSRDGRHGGLRQVPDRGYVARPLLQYREGAGRQFLWRSIVRQGSSSSVRQ